MTLSELKNKLANTPTTIEFDEVISLIGELYDFTPTEFKNGDTKNNPNQNNGSCKLFAFAQLQNFSKEETLACFGIYYHKFVLENPNGSDHQNIRNFIKYGWNGIEFKEKALHAK